MEVKIVQSALGNILIGLLKFYAKLITIIRTNNITIIKLTTAHKLPVAISMDTSVLYLRGITLI